MRPAGPGDLAPVASMLPNRQVMAEQPSTGLGLERDESGPGHDAALHVLVLWPIGRLQQGRATFFDPEAGSCEEAEVLSGGEEASMAVEGMSGAPFLLVRAAPWAVQGHETDDEASSGPKHPSGLCKHGRRILREAERDDEHDGAEGAVTEWEVLTGAAHGTDAACLGEDEGRLGSVEADVDAERCSEPS